MTNWRKNLFDSEASYTFDYIHIILINMYEYYVDYTLYSYIISYCVYSETYLHNGNRISKIGMSIYPWWKSNLCNGIYLYRW